MARRRFYSARPDSEESKPAAPAATWELFASGDEARRNAARGVRLFAAALPGPVRESAQEARACLGSSAARPQKAAHLSRPNLSCRRELKSIRKRRRPVRAAASDKRMPSPKFQRRTPLLVWDFF